MDNLQDELSRQSSKDQVELKSFSERAGIDRGSALATLLANSNLAQSGIRNLTIPKSDVTSYSNQKQNRSRLTSVIRLNFLTERDFDKPVSRITTVFNLNLSKSPMRRSSQTRHGSTNSITQNNKSSNLEDTKTQEEKNSITLASQIHSTNSLLSESFDFSKSELFVWDLEQIDNLKKEINTINQDMCDILCIGCYHIYSSLINQAHKKQFLTRNLKLNRPFRMEIRSKEDYVKEWENEVKIMRWIQKTKPSPFILKIKDSLQTHGHILMVYEYMECGTLENRMLKETFTDIQSIFYAECILLAMGHLHKLNIVHGNISLKEIYLSALGMAKLSDFRKAYREEKTFQNEDFIKEKYKDITSWAICLQNMLIGKIFYAPNVSSILEIDNQDAKDLLKKVFRRHKLLEKCAFISKLPPSEVSNVSKIMKHALFKPVNWATFNKGIVISPDFHQLVVEEKVCPKEEWMKILNTILNTTEFDNNLFLREHLWIKYGDVKLTSPY